MQPKVLVGCPTAWMKEYCLDDYAEIVKSLTYSNYDVLIVDNSKDNDYFDKLKNKDLPVVKGEYFEGAKDRIIHSRNILREHVLKNNYDYFFSLEQDVIPPKDVIERLLNHDKKVISGVYFNFQIVNNERKPSPMLWERIDENGNLVYLEEEKIFTPQLLKIAACGLGCILIHKDILEKIKFRYQGNKGFDDVWFSKDLRENNFDIYVDTSIRCQHITVPGGKWKDIKK